MISSRPAASSRSQAQIVCALLVVVALQGCASTQYVSLRKTPRNPLAEQLQLFSKSGPKPSPRVTQVLRRYGLPEDPTSDSRTVLRKLEKLHEQEPSAQSRYALAEIAYISAVKARPRDKALALDYFGTAVTHAYQYLFDHRLAWQRNVYDPEFRSACNIYNTALEDTLRITLQDSGLASGATHDIDSGNRRCSVSVVSHASTWKPEDFSQFEFVSDYEVQGLTNQYHSYGLGVPLIGVRRKPDNAGPVEKFYPPDLSMPVTAFLRVMPLTAEEAQSPDHPRRAQLELYDPLATHDIDISGVRVPLEYDFSTPLAYFLNKPGVETLTTLTTMGLIRPDTYEGLRGLYMVQPYEPGKIPVLMVHGLWSSPITWMEMFNDLRSDPQIRKHYQFWFYLYPTGQPFWVSAAQLRRDLVETREVLDQQRQQEALDHMILVGHSMGGLVSNMQTVESGDTYWQTVSTQPIHLIKADDDVKSRLQGAFYFNPNPSVRRVITIGTPHRGSDFANDTTRWLSRKLITMPQMLVQGSQQLYRDNPDAFSNQSILKIPTSIDSLAPDCPILPVLLEAPRPPYLKRHNIVGVVQQKSVLNRVSGKGDGVVSYDSAHLENIDSEIVVDADHMSVHRHPHSVLEVRRILLEHLNEIRHQPDPRHPRVYTVSTGAPPPTNAVGNPWPQPQFAPPRPTPYPAREPSGPVLVAPY